MRFVPANAIRSGMINARPIFGRNQEMLLREGIPLNDILIKRIIDLGYNGIYIHYNHEEDLPFAEVIDNQLRIEAVGKIKKAFIAAEKPLSVEEVIRQKKDLGQVIEKLIDDLLKNKHLMINMIDLKVFDDYTFYHSVNVSVIAMVLGDDLNLSRQQLYKLGLASLLHDIGKIMMPKEIVDKPDFLSAEEFEVMKGHSEEGYRYLRDIYDVPVPVYMAVKFHHEQHGGGGYPLGLIGDDIPLFAKIITVADVFDALTSDRVYRKALNPADAVEFVMANTDVMFDPDVVRIFLKKVAPYPIGTMVHLSDGRVGTVIANYEGYGLRPTLRIEKDGNRLNRPYTLDMMKKGALDVTILGFYEDSDLY